MKKRILPLLVTLLLVVTSASASGQSSSALLQSALSGDHSWDGYALLSKQAKIKLASESGSPVAVAALHHKNHNILVTTSTCEDDVTSFIRYAVTSAVWQPEDGGPVFQALQPLTDCNGFTLCYRPSDQYNFAIQRDTYRLTSAQIGETSYQWNEDQACYLALGQDVLSGVYWAPPNGQITLTDFNIRLFPHTVEDAARLNVLYNRINTQLKVQTDIINRKATEKLPVYSAPSESAWRAANGTASVSLKQTVNLFGITENAEGIWTCVEYIINNQTSRIGYVKSNLKTGCSALSLGSQSMITSQASYLTDDPDVSQTVQKSIPAGTQLTVLAVYNDYYAYAESEIDGQLFRGFVPLSAL